MSLFNYLGRKVLYLWVKTETIPTDMGKLAINPELPELNQWRSVYTIAPRQPFKAWLEQQPKRSRMLRGIVENLREIPEQEIQFVPVQIFWGRPVAKQKHWIQLLFAESWDFF